jgi:hypothetical protein
MFPTEIEALAGKTVTETSASGTTLRVAVPVTPSTVVLMIETPAATPVAKPELVIVATAGADEFQFAELVKLS